MASSTITMTLSTSMKPLRAGQNGDELLDLLNTYKVWTDPLSKNIQLWASESLEIFSNHHELTEEALTKGLMDRIKVLKEKVLVSSVDRKPFKECPYLIDGETVLPESEFDQLYQVSAQEEKDITPPSLFNHQPMARRQKVHEFALELLRWSGLQCDPTPIPDPVDYQPVLAHMQYCRWKTKINNYLAGLIKKQSAEDQEQNADNHLYEASQIKPKIEKTSEQRLAALRAQHSENLERNAQMREAHMKLAADLENQIIELTKKIIELESRVGDAEEVNRENQRKIADLQRQIQEARDEIARIRAEIDNDSGCTIL